MFQKLHLIVSQTNVVISEGFYYLERHTIAQGDILLQYEDEEEIFRRILPVIPKVRLSECIQCVRYYS